MEKVLARGEKIEILVEKTESMVSISEDFRKNAREMKNIMCWKNYKWTVYLIIIISAVVYGALVYFCNGFALQGCL